MQIGHRGDIDIFRRTWEPGRVRHSMEIHVIFGVYNDDWRSGSSFENIISKHILRIKFIITSSDTDIR